MPKNEDRVCSFCGLMALGCGVCLIIFLWIFWVRGFENIFKSTYFVFVYLPLLVIAVTFFFFALVGKNRIREKYHWFFAIILFFFWAASGLHFITKVSNEKADKSNEIGDSFGSINALFSGMALAAVAFTIILQKQELEQNRKELVGQKNELKAQNATQIQARFENSFFSLLEAQRVISKSIIFPGASQNKINPFKSIISEYELAAPLNYNFLNDIIFEDNREKFHSEFIGRLQKRRMTLVEKFNDLGSLNDGKYNNYFMITYRILKFLDDFKFDKIVHIDNASSQYKISDKSTMQNEKNIIRDHYVRILQSQIGQYELLVIFYYALNPNHGEFKYLIEKYNIFNSLGLHLIPNANDIFLYNVSAFSKTMTENRNIKLIITNPKEFYNFFFPDLSIDNNPQGLYNLRIMVDVWTKELQLTQIDFNSDTIFPGIAFKRSDSESINIK